ncbi:unnamed protein product [Orchesella dallaii]|uniref:Uncharacterized protein n=1 Tax=Orchesella dallaii TaxID=48710 RepID=A0ABP1R4K8_9HEXA
MRTVRLSSLPCLHDELSNSALLLVPPPALQPPLYGSCRISKAVDKDSSNVMIQQSHTNSFEKREVAEGHNARFELDEGSEVDVLSQWEIESGVKQLDNDGIDGHKNIDLYYDPGTPNE